MSTAARITYPTRIATAPRHGRQRSLSADRFGLALAALVAGCFGCEPGTGGRSVFFEVAVEVPGPDAAVFTTTTGWDVELTSAHLVLGPMYLHELPSFSGGAAADEASNRAAESGGWLSRRDRAALWTAAYEWVVPTAQAHAGDAFFDGGTLMGEYLGQHVIDLLGEPRVVLGSARGVAGEVRAVTVILDPPSGVAAGPVGQVQGGQASVEGVARRTSDDGLEEVAFRGRLLIPDRALDRQIDGISADFNLDDDGLFVLRVELSTWLDRAHFDRLELVDDDGVHRINAGSQPALAWSLGLRNATTFSGYWEPAP